MDAKRATKVRKTEHTFVQTKAKRGGGHREKRVVGGAEQRAGSEGEEGEEEREFRVCAYSSQYSLFISIAPCLSSVRPSARPSVFVFRFSSSLGLCVARLSLPATVCPSPPPDQVRWSTYLSASCLARATFYIFQAVFTFEIKRGTNSGRRALMVTVQSVRAASNVLEKSREPSVFSGIPLLRALAA